MKICLVAAFPPSKRQLNEYSFHLARELQRHPEVELTILADEVTSYDFATDADGHAAKLREKVEASDFHVIRCWKFGSVATPLRILNQIRRIKPDIVWFNLAFSTFGTPKSPIPAFAGLSIPALTRAAGFFTHITLHHIVEHCDFGAAGVKLDKIYRLGSEIATQALLKADSVSVLLSDYRKTLMQKYYADNILVGTHGTFTTTFHPPDLSRRGDPEHRILAFGNWGTYKRLEPLMAAFPSILERVPNARLIVAGGNHPAAAGYWESIRDAQPDHLPIDFLGYIPQENIANLFQTSSVLVMPYDSSTGSSGPAHQACEFGLPIVCADIKDFRCMAEDDEMAISFYEKGNITDLADKLVAILNSPQLLQQMSEHNYDAGVQMSMDTVVRDYLRWFDLQLCKRYVANAVAAGDSRSRVPRIDSTLAETARGRVLPFPSAESIRHHNGNEIDQDQQTLSAFRSTQSSPRPVSLSRSRRPTGKLDEDGCVDLG